MKNLIFICFLIILSCKTDVNDDNTIISKIEANCHNNIPCNFLMADVIKSDWDTMYYFTESVSLKEVNEKIGLNYPYFSDIAKRVIFIKNNSIVYHEDIFPSVEKPKNKEWSIGLPDSINYQKYDRLTANFLLEKIIIKNITVYKLHAIKQHSK